MFYLLHVKSAFSRFVKNGVYWLDAVNVQKVPPGNHIYPATAIKPYTDQQNMLLVRSGGLGDLMDLSSLVGIAHNTVLLSQSKYRSLVGYFAEQCIFKSYDESLFITKFPKQIEQYFEDIGMMYGDQMIENGYKRNWFEVFYESINFPFDPEYGRPNLISKTKNQNNTCLIVPSASCINRTADRLALKSAAIRAGYKVVMADEQKWTTAQYLQALDEAGFVISVDTSAIHFREGIKKPALGIYGAFTMDSRTKYYKYTKSIDIKSNCPIQPCFKHEMDRCVFLTKESKFAECLGGESFEQQVYDALINAKFE